MPTRTPWTGGSTALALTLALSEGEGNYSPSVRKAQQNLSPTCALSAPALAAFRQADGPVGCTHPTNGMVPWRFDSARGGNREACRWSDYSSDTA